MLNVVYCVLHDHFYVWYDITQADAACILVYNPEKKAFDNFCCEFGSTFCLQSLSNELHCTQYLLKSLL